MKNGLYVGDRRSWGVAAAIAAIIVIGLSLLFRSPRTVPAPESLHNPASQQATQSGVGVSMGLTRLDPTQGNALLNEEATLFDPTPLFLPTEWNVGHNTLPENTMRDIGRTFENYAPRLVFQEVGLALGFPAPVEVPAKVTEALPLLGRQQPFLGMGRTDPVMPALPGRGARIEVMSVKDGQEALSLDVSVERLPQTVWQPLEFLLAVDAAGLIGPPTLMVRSSDEELNATFQNLLVKVLRLGERLPPGVYRVCVGP